MALAGRGRTDGHVFLSYVREDSALVDELETELLAAGIPVWRDINDLWPGDLWRRRLREAIEADALAYVPCFSSRLARRKRSTMYAELAWAVDEIRSRSPHSPWIIPVLFDDCTLPEYDLGGGLTLADLQWVDLRGERRAGQLERLITVLRRMLGHSSWRLEEVGALTPFDGRCGRLGADFLAGTSGMVVWDEVDDGSSYPPHITDATGRVTSELALGYAERAKHVQVIDREHVLVANDDAVSIVNLPHRSVVAVLTKEEVGDQ
jgi:TIR domain